MLTFRVADEATQELIDQSKALSAKKLRPLLGAGAGAMGELFSELTRFRAHNQVLAHDDFPSRPAWSKVDKQQWQGSAKLRIEDALAIGKSSGVSVNDNSMVVSIGGSQTTVTGNLEMFEDYLIFVPHGVWQARGVDLMRIETDQPIQFSGIMDDQQGRRALAVMVRPSTTIVVFRIGMILNGLDDFIAARLAPI